MVLSWDGKRKRESSGCKRYARVVSLECHIELTSKWLRTLEAIKATAHRIDGNSRSITCRMWNIWLWILLLTAGLAQY